MFILFVLFTTGTCFHYGKPITIDTELVNRSYIFIYESDLEMIFTATDQTITVYDLYGRVINFVTLNMSIESMIITRIPSFLVSGPIYNDLYEYSFYGQFLRKISICGYHHKSKLIFDGWTSDYYVIHNLGWIYDVLSFTSDSALLNHTFINSVDNSFNLGYETGNILVGAGNVFSIYDRNMTTVTSMKLPYNNAYWIIGGFEVNETTVCIIYDKFYIYAYDGSLIDVFSFDRAPIELKDIRFNRKYNLVTFLQLENIGGKNRSVIKFGDFHGRIIYKLNFEDDINNVYNIYGLLDERTDIVIMNINSKIKIWKPT
jgi:hypothetical protein